MPVINPPSSNTWSAVAYNTNIPLNTQSVMPQTYIGAATTFSAANAVAGGQCYARFVSNGSNVPTFSGMTEWGGSSGWVNTLGIVNNVQFFNDGLKNYYSVTQDVNVSALMTPTISSAVIEVSTPTQIQITFSASLNPANVPAISAFAITNSGGTDNVTSVSISGAVLTINKSRTTLSGDTVSLAYTAPATAQLQDTNQNPVYNFTGQAITNNLAPSTTFIRLTTIDSLTETVNGGGYNYSSATGSSNYEGVTTVNCGVATLGIPNGTDAYVGFTVGTVGGSSKVPALGLNTSGTNSNSGSWTYGVYCDQTVNANYRMITSGSGGGAADTNVAAATSDVVRLRRAGTTLTAEISKDSGTNWTVVKTWTSVTTSKLYPHFSLTNGGTAAVQPYGSGNVA